MRFRDDRSSAALAARLGLSAGLILLLAGCGVLGGSRVAGPSSQPVMAANGPAADYPVIVGEPYTVEGTTYVPVDTLNYDEVGYAVADAAGGPEVSGSHRTLPLPSYVEVTSLDTGRTILVRLRRRGPMSGGETSLVSLSPGAFAQLDAQPGTPVRVRRVNPMEVERAKLRAGEQASLRMDTPQSLVNVLRRKLPEAPQLAAAETEPNLPAAPVEVAAVAEPDPPKATPSVIAAIDPDEARVVEAAEEADFTEQMALPELAPVEAVPEPVSQAEQTLVAAEEPIEPETVATAGAYVVQAGAFSTRIRAERVADTISGDVTQAGKYYRVRTGPFVDRDAAEASLAKVKAAGYTDARIFTNG